MAEQTPAPSSPEKSARGRFMDGWGWKAAALGLVVSLLAAFFGYWLQSREPHLTVLVPEVARFESEKNRFAISTFYVTNDGNKEAENVECILTVPAGKINDMRAWGDEVSPKISYSEGKAVVSIGLLNPGEGLAVNAWITGPVPNVVAWSARGKGVVGERGQNRLENLEKQRRVSFVLSCIQLATLLVFAPLPLLERWRQRRYLAVSRLISGGAV